MRTRQLKQRPFALAFDDHALHNPVASVIRILLQKYVWSAYASAAGMQQTFLRSKKPSPLLRMRNSNSARSRLMTMPSTIRWLRSSVFSFKNASDALAPPLPVCSKLSPGRKKLSPLMRMRQLKQRLFALDDHAFHNPVALVIRILFQKYVWRACASAAGV